MTAVPVPAQAPTTLFTVSFESELSDRDLAQLAGSLDLTAHAGAESGPLEQRLGPARLDHDSGLFLERDGGDGRWILEGRTWGRPGSRAVHGWHVMAAQAAHRLDPAVIAPERLAEAGSPTPDRPVGAAANKRLAHARRRLVGLR